MKTTALQLFPFYDEMTRMNSRMDCNWTLASSLDEIRSIIQQKRMPKKHKARLLADLDHLESHLAEDVKVMCNDVKDRQN